MTSWLIAFFVGDVDRLRRTPRALDVDIGYAPAMQYDLPGFGSGTPPAAALTPQRNDGVKFIRKEVLRVLAREADAGGPEYAAGWRTNVNRVLNMPDADLFPRVVWAPPGADYLFLVAAQSENGSLREFYNLKNRLFPLHPVRNVQRQLMELLNIRWRDGPVLNEEVPAAATAKIINDACLKIIEILEGEKIIPRYENYKKTHVFRRNWERTASIWLPFIAELGWFALLMAEVGPKAALGLAGHWIWESVTEQVLSVSMALLRTFRRLPGFRNLATLLMRRFNLPKEYDAVTRKTFRYRDRRSHFWNVTDVIQIVGRTVEMFTGIPLYQSNPELVQSFRLALMKDVEDWVIYGGIQFYDLVKGKRLLANLQVYRGIVTIEPEERQKWDEIALFLNAGIHVVSRPLFQVPAEVTTTLEREVCRPYRLFLREKVWDQIQLLNSRYPDVALEQSSRVPSALSEFEWNASNWKFEGPDWFYLWPGKGTAEDPVDPVAIAAKMAQYLTDVKAVQGRIAPLYLPEQGIDNWAAVDALLVELKGIQAKAYHELKKARFSEFWKPDEAERFAGRVFNTEEEAEAEVNLFLHQNDVSRLQIQQAYDEITQLIKTETERRKAQLEQLIPEDSPLFPYYAIYRGFLVDHSVLINERGGRVIVLRSATVKYNGVETLAAVVEANAQTSLNSVRDAFNSYLGTVERLREAIVTEEVAAAQKAGFGVTDGHLYDYFQSEEKRIRTEIDPDFCDFTELSLNLVRSIILATGRIWANVHGVRGFYRTERRVYGKVTRVRLLADQMHNAIIDPANEQRLVIGGDEFRARVEQLLGEINGGAAALESPALPLAAAQRALEAATAARNSVYPLGWAGPPPFMAQTIDARRQAELAIADATAARDAEPGNAEIQARYAQTVEQLNVIENPPPPVAPAAAPVVAGRGRGRGRGGAAGRGRGGGRGGAVAVAPVVPPVVPPGPGPRRSGRAAVQRQLMNL